MMWDRVPAWGCGCLQVHHAGAAEQPLIGSKLFKINSNEHANVIVEDKLLPKHKLMHNNSMMH